MRLKYTDDPPKMANPADQAWVEKLVKQRGKLGLGPLYRSLLISPNFARGFLQFFGAIRYQSSLPADVMELAMCRVGALNGAAFEWVGVPCFQSVIGALLVHHTVFVVLRW